VVIRKLDAIGFSPVVMQSNNDFGVASTFSVNAHGWPVPFSGCGSTVRAITMLLADGTLVNCSRREHADLFRHAMGGYGLVGVITELELDMVPNALLTPTFETMSGKDIGPRFAQRLASDSTIQMAYGRMDVALDRFFDRALLITYRPASDQSEIPAASGSGFISRSARYVFRAQVESDRAKRFRWWTESGLGPWLAGDATRNSLMNEPVITLDDRDPRRTDILHEYFVPPARFAEFVTACQDVIPASYQQLLNITLRYVNTDTDSVLGYAPEPRIAAVLLFSQEKTVRGEVDMAGMTRSLIDRVLEIGGTYYLPYRPHASIEQLRLGYPRAGAFAATKRELDPELLLLSDPNFHRREANTYLTYPEWHIVYAYDGLAETLKAGDEHAFDYIESIAGFWRSTCSLMRRADRHGGADWPTRSMIHTIGVSFTAEMALKRFTRKPSDVARRGGEDLKRRRKTRRLFAWRSTTRPSCARRRGTPIHFAAR
jgi:FAD/FMN-containing dehydrogenase